MKGKIEKIIEKMRPYIQMHGGDLELLEITDNIAKIKISGACVGCQMADMTYNQILGGAIREEIPEIKEIIFVN